jgi:hypothetical protein
MLDRNYRLRLLAGALASAVLAAPAISNPVYDQEKFGAYLELRDCTAMLAAAAIVYGREIGQNVPRFHYFADTAQSGEARLLGMIESGLVAPTGDLVTRSQLEAGWEQHIQSHISALQEGSDLGEDAWDHAAGCASDLKL